MRSAAQNLRTPVAMAVDGKSRAALFRVFCSHFRSPPPPPVLQSSAAPFRGFCSTLCSSPPLPILQLSDRTTADGGAAPDVITPPPHLPPPCDQNAAGGTPWLEELDRIILRSDFEVGDSRLLAPRQCPGITKYSDPANDCKLVSLADYCVQQISQIQDSQYKQKL